MLFKRERYLTAVGLFFILLGCVGAYFFVYQGLKLELLQLNVFTFYSQYLKVKTFSVINNNQGDELTVVCYSMGWLILLYGQVRSLISMKLVLIVFYTLGYLLIHGLAVIYFTFFFILLLPCIFFLKK